MHCNSFGILRKRWWCNKRSLSERHGIRQRLLSICDRDGWKILKLKSKVVLWFKDVKDGGIKEATSHAKKRSNKSAAAADGKSNVLRLVLWQGPKPGGMPNQLVEIRSGVGGARRGWPAMAVAVAALLRQPRIFVLVGSGRSVFGKAHHQPCLWLSLW